MGSYLWFRNAGDTFMSALVDQLRDIVGSESCLARAEELFVYECDGLTLDPSTPSVVVLPSCTQEVVEIVKACRKHNTPFVPRGAGTGLSGGAHAKSNAVVIETSRMKKVLEVDVENRIARVQPGLVNLDLSNAVAPHGLYYAPDPSSQQVCTIGGNVAENSGGPHTLKYGATTDNVVSLELVMPDGEVLRLGTDSGYGPGYDLVGVVTGSEGTLGIVTEVTVKLLAVPESLETMLGIFPDVVSACRAVMQIVGSGLVPAAMEIIDRRTIEVVEDSIYRAGLPRDAGAVLLAEIDGARCALDDQVARMREFCREAGATDVKIARDAEERDLFWKARKGSFGAMGRLAPDIYVHDAVVPRAHLPEILEQVNEIGVRYGLVLANVFHAGDGNLHPIIAFDKRDEEELDRVLKAGREILEACLAVGGVLTGEHGVGTEKQEFMSLLFSDDDLDAMLRLRRAFNPDGCCNPGKVLPVTRACVESNPAARAGLLELIP
ncbi:MAG: glycolate oxidase subunit GlcD [Myxococcota bacterium]|jgi:glycolate oxidase subunit GlcD